MVESMLVQRKGESIKGLTVAHQTRGGKILKPVRWMLSPATKRRESKRADYLLRYRRKDLLALSLRLAETPCSPLYKSAISPDRELLALVKTTGFVV
jgi:hypothetical protein